MNKKIKLIWCPKTLGYKEVQYEEDTSVKELDNTVDKLKTIFGMSDN